VEGTTEKIRILQGRSGYYREDSQILEVVEPEVASVPGSLLTPFLRRDLGRRLNPEGGGTTGPWWWDHSVVHIAKYCGL